MINAVKKRVSESDMISDKCYYSDSGDRFW